MEQECKKLEPLLCLYIDNQLSASERQMVDDHLSQCPICKVSIEEFKKTSAFLEESYDPNTPPEINLDGVWNEIESQVKWNSPGYLDKIKKLLGEPALWVPAFAAGAAALIIFMQVQGDRSTAPQFTMVEPAKPDIIAQQIEPDGQGSHVPPGKHQNSSPLKADTSKAEVSRVESVYSSTGRVMVLQTAQSGQPLIWILPEPEKKEKS